MSPSDVWRDCVIVKEEVRKPDKERPSDSLFQAPAGESEAAAPEGDCVKVHYCGFDAHNGCYPRTTPLATFCSID